MCMHDTLFPEHCFLIIIITRSNRRLCSAFDILAIDEQRATCNLLLATCVKKCYFPHRGDVSTEQIRSSSVSNVIKAVTAFFFGSLIGACYDSKRHKAIVTQDRITRKICELMVCRYGSDYSALS